MTGTALVPNPARVPLSLYVHVPWCVRKCPYCDFNSHALDADPPEADYLTAIVEDLRYDLGLIQGRSIQTVFIGGGTPSLMSAAFYHQLFDALRQVVPIAPDAEITLEANPGTVDQERFHGFQQAGINRLSLGIQSFNRHQLKVLGRIHDDRAANQAIEAALNAGFDNFNLDLMHGLPDQTPEEALADLESALSWQPPHLSWYQL
ncbi:MAG: radical SAM family heme chaperone HemW, partial [Marinobacter sp.]|nr:radical SAM family heme chaperone HemW [Marinobacter sp.]